MRSLANAIEERVKATYNQGEIVREVIDKVVPVVNGQIRDLEAIQRTMSEVLPLLEEVRQIATTSKISGEALLAHLREDEEIVNDFLHHFAADTTLVINLTEIMSSDPQFVAHVIELVDEKTLTRAIMQAGKDKIRKALEEA